MKILIPMAGLGKRFQEFGYSDPKPLIKIFGDEMIQNVISNLDISSDDELIIIYNKILEKFNFESLLNFKNSINIKFLKLENDTKGATETVFKYLEKINSNEPILIIDCDTIYYENIISKCKNTKENKIFYSINKDKDPIYSYIKINNQGLVEEIKEKCKISDNANVGAYFFKSINEFKEYALKLINNSNEQNELYISKVYDLMLKDNISIQSEQIKDFYCVGTPLQLQKYCAAHKNNKKRFVFDLDNTLVSYPEIKGDYSTVKPIEKNIKFLNFLKSLGNYIIIYSARRMKTFNGNVKLVEHDIREITEKTLKKFNVEYDELILGKPYANFYIDDLAIYSYDDLEKKTGFYNTSIDPRDFHKIEVYDNLVVKYGNLQGECYWYKNIPKEIHKYIPKIHKLSDSVIEMEKVNGIALSFLNVNGTLSKKEFNQLFSILNIIHQYKYVENIDIKTFYLNKLKQRYENKIYKNLQNSYDFYSFFVNYFENLNLNNLSLIHGDPVFSNILYTVNNDIIFIDPRGLVEQTKCIYGDIFYDYAKIYQSICGYDYILLNKELNLESIQINKNIFKEYFLQKFSEKEFEYVKILKDYLIYTLLPLHSDEVKINKYYNLIELNN